MPAVTWANVIAFAPEMSDVPFEVQMRILAHVNALNPRGFGGATKPKYTLARIYMAAHFGSFALPDSGGNAGPVTSETLSADSYSVDYSDAAVGVGGVQSFEQTSYGQQYLQLAATSLSRLPFVP